MKKLAIANPVQVVTDGQTAIEYLAGGGRYLDREAFPPPGLLLLDLQLPRRSGFDVLEWISAHREVEAMVVVLTSSGEERDVLRAFSLGAQSYLVKPPRPESVHDLMRALVAHRSAVARRERLLIAGGRYPAGRAGS